MEIIKTGNVINSEDSMDAFTLLGMDWLYHALKRNAIVIAACVIIALFISFLFVDNAKISAEKKQDIESKLLILIVICSAVTLFGWMKTFFDAMFY